MTKSERSKIIQPRLIVNAKSGEMRLSDISLNTKLRSFNLRTKKEVFNKVESIERSKEKGVFYCLNGRVILFENQSIFANRNVTHVKLLKVGDRLVGEDGQIVIIHSIVKLKGRYDFFKLSVGGNHGYFVNGLLLHNASRYWVGGTANWDSSTTTNWSATSGGLGGSSVPSSSDDVTFDTLSNLTAYTCTVTATANCSDLTMSNPLTGALSFAGTSALNCFGNFSAPSGATWTYSGTFTMAATATGKTFATNGVVIAGPLTFQGTGGGWTLQDNLDAGNNNLSFFGGNLNTNGKNIIARLFNWNTGNTVNLTLGASIISLSRTSGATWVAPAIDANHTLSAGTSVIKFTGALTGTVTFSGNGHTYNNFENATTNAFSLQINGSNTFNEFKDSNSTAHSILFSAGITTTVASFIVIGTAGNLKTINSTTTATHDLVKTGGGTISCDYLNIQHSVATPASTWYAGLNSTNNQGVATAGSGWIFTAPPAPASDLTLSKIDKAPRTTIRKINGASYNLIKKVTRTKAN